MDVNEKLNRILKQKNISYYQLAKLADLPQSTLANLRQRGSVPTIYTIEQICKGLDISLAEFFMDENAQKHTLTPYQAELLQYAALTSPYNQQLLLTIAKAFR